MGERKKFPVWEKPWSRIYWIWGMPPCTLRGADPEQMYERRCEQQGVLLDRCVLYVYRCAVYYASTPPEQHQPELLKWWNWKDK